MKKGDVKGGMKKGGMKKKEDIVMKQVVSLVTKERQHERG